MASGWRVSCVCYLPSACSDMGVGSWGTRGASGRPVHTVGLVFPLCPTLRPTSLQWFVCGGKGARLGEGNRALAPCVVSVLSGSPLASFRMSV